MSMQTVLYLKKFHVAAEPEIAYATNPHTREKLDEFIGHYNQMFGSAYYNQGQSEFL